MEYYLNLRIKGGATFAKSAYQKFGPMTRGEWITFIIFIMAASLWIFRPLLVYPTAKTGGIF
ncbi:MAG: anion permease [Desulfobacterales bacterium]|nr:anion permease [Desulfobacterales bacterium]